MSAIMMRLAPLLCLLYACSGRPAPELTPAKEGFDVGERLPPLAWSALAPDGTSARLETRSLSGAPATLLVFRTLASWCGPCLWHAAQPVPEGVEFIDLLVGDEDNFLPDEAALRRWRERQHTPGWVAADPEVSLSAAERGFTPLPRFLVVEAQSMEVLWTLSAPDPDFLAGRLAQELSRRTGVGLPDIGHTELFEERFNRLEWSMLQGMRHVGEPPADPSNEHADDPEAAALGRELFFDTRLSPSNSVSCASCHRPELSFADGRSVSLGTGLGERNAPSLLFASHARWQFWDGRSDSLWAQALQPFENPVEFDSARTFLVRRIAEHHREAWESAFGALPDFSDSQRFPEDAKPGRDSWEAMSEEDRRLVNEVFVTAGKSIAAYERGLRVLPNRFDAWLEGDPSALTAEEKDGALMFFRAGCVQCHHGPRLTNDAFHNLRFPTGRQDVEADSGLHLGLEALRDDPFAGHRLAGRQAGARALGAFRTPPLRGVPSTAPYGHGGTFATLRETVEHYLERGLPADDPRALGETEPWVPKFAASHVDPIVAFLKTLEAVSPEH